MYKDFLFEVTKFAIEKDFLFDQIMTNGCWWKSEEELSQTLQDLYDAGFDGKIGLSWDIFHNQNEERRFFVTVTKSSILFGRARTSPL